MKTYFPHIITTLFLFLFLQQKPFAQSQTAAKASVDKNKILIGEPFTLTLEVTVPQNEAIRFFTIDTIPHFEFLEQKKIDTTDNRGGTRLVQQLKMTSFDSGSFVIPQFVLDNVSGLKTDSIPLEVAYTSPFDPAAPYHDVKDVLDQEVKETKNNNWMYIVAAAVLLLLVIIILLVTRKKKPKPAAPAISAFEKAMQRLDQLQKSNAGNKQFYSTLTEVFREYLSERKNIQSLSPTTDELVMSLKDVKLPVDAYTSLAQTLRLGDFVKFAKYQPAVQENDAAFNSIRSGIQAIEKNITPITTTP